MSKQCQGSAPSLSWWNYTSTNIHSLDFLGKATNYQIKESSILHQIKNSFSSICSIVTTIIIVPIAKIGAYLWRNSRSVLQGGAKKLEYVCSANFHWSIEVASFSDFLQSMMIGTSIQRVSEHCFTHEKVSKESTDSERCEMLIYKLAGGWYCLYCCEYCDLKQEA